MKKIFIKISSTIVIFLIIAIVVIPMANQQKMVVIKKGNIDKKPLDIQLNHYQDSDCGMVIETLNFASQVIAPDGRTWFFHDHGGMVHWLEDKSFKDKAVIWVMSLDTKKWIDGRKAFYSLTDKTPMNNGFGAYEHKQKNFVDFETMRLKMLRGETLNNPLIRQKLLGE
jgi:nitrous oxide reductase accessory protein NosL